MIISAAETVEDPFGNEVDIERGEDHATRDNKDHPNKNEIEETIRNPDEIWESGNNRLFVKYINGRWLVVRVYLYDGVRGVSTAAYEGPNYEDVKNLLKRKDYDIPSDRIYEK